MASTARTRPKLTINDRTQNFSAQLNERFVPSFQLKSLRINSTFDKTFLINMQNLLFCLCCDQLQCHFLLFISLVSMRSFIWAFVSLPFTAFDRLRIAKLLLFIFNHKLRFFIGHGRLRGIASHPLTHTQSLFRAIACRTIDESIAGYGKNQFEFYQNGNWIEQVFKRFLISLFSVSCSYYR